MIGGNHPHLYDDYDHVSLLAIYDRPICRTEETVSEGAKVLSFIHNMLL